MALVRDWRWAVGDGGQEGMRYRGPARLEDMQGVEQIIESLVEFGAAERQQEAGGRRQAGAGRLAGVLLGAGQAVGQVHD